MQPPQKGQFAAAVFASRVAGPASVSPAITPCTPVETGTLVETEEATGEAEAGSPEDVLVSHSQAAINTVSKNTELTDRIRTSWLSWMGILKPLEDALPDVLDDRNKIAFDLVPEFTNQIFGEGKWDTEEKAQQEWRRNDNVGRFQVTI